MDNVTLRPETPGDYRETEIMMREAFWNVYAPGCCEHFVLHCLRKSRQFVPELATVAVHNGRIVGAAACMRSLIATDAHTQREVLCLGPIAVSPRCQRGGIGRQLIAHTCSVAQALGFKAILLCGDPAYYARSGFVPAEQFGIRTADDWYAAALQARELCPEALAGAGGRFVEDPAYEVRPEDAEAFDRDFPRKEKTADTPSQRRFAEVVAMRRKA